MSKIRLTGETSGYVEISAGDAATNNTLELPTSGTKVVASDDNGNITTAGIVTATGGFGVGTGASVYSPATNVLALGTNSAERVRINSSGSVGIGTDNPISGRGTSGKVLNVTGNGTNSIISVQAIEGVNDRNAILELLASGNGGSAAEIVFGNTDATPVTNSPLVFSSYYSGSTVERARISNTGNFQIANGNLEFSTSGKGIDFSAASGSAAGSTSAVLNDYEEGTWTPYWSDYYGTNLFVNNDINLVHATYTKINKMIIYSTYFTSDASFSYNTAGGINGSTPANIGGLPFTSNGYHAGVVGYYANWTGYDAPNYGYTPMTISNASQTTLRLQFPTTNTSANITASNLAASNSAIIVSGVYYTA